MNFELTQKNSAALKQAELKKDLVESIQLEHSRFAEIADVFYRLENRSHEDYLKLCEEIIAAVDHVLTKGEWETSLFLRNTLRPLLQIQEEVVELQKVFLKQQTQSIHQTQDLQPGQKKLYVSLYQADGLNLRKWEDQIKTIATHMTGRPIYQEEKSVEHVMRSRMLSAVEAYIVVVVAEQHILPAEQMKVRKDRLGNELVNVMEGKINAENVLEFVHLGRRYFFRRNKLVLRQDID